MRCSSRVKYSQPQRVFQVFLNGKQHKKVFKAKNLETIYEQFNKWAKSQGADTYVMNADYIGMMAWKTKKGIAEIREIKILKNIARGEE